jgi:hypothetical protein
MEPLQVGDRLPLGLRGRWSRSRSYLAGALFNA